MMHKVFDSVYWKIPVFSQKFMGIWPYDNSFRDKCMRVFVYISLYTLIIPLGLRMYEEAGKDSEIILENIIGEMYLHSGLFKFTISIVSRKRFVQLNEMLANDWRKTVDPKEISIMEKHAKNGRRNYMIYAMYLCSTTACFILIPSLDPLLNILMPLENGTRPLGLPYYAEYYLDQEKYYVPLMMKASVSGTLSMMIFITYDMAFAMYIHHICSQFDIVRYRIKVASALGSKGQHDEARDFLIKAIEQHQTIIINVNLIEQVCSKTWLMVLTITMVGFAGSLCCVIKNVNKPKEMLRHGMFFSAVLSHKFFIFSLGQKIVDYSYKTFNSCYDCHWYNFTPENKTLIKIMLMRKIRPLKLTGGKVFELSMETLSRMLRTGMSYFAVYAGNINRI